MQRLKQYLSDSNVTQADLAKRCNVSQPTIWEWVHGKSKPSADSLVLLSAVTGVSIDELLSEQTAA